MPSARTQKEGTGVGKEWLPELCGRQGHLDRAADSRRGDRGGGEDDVVNLSDFHSGNQYLLSVCPDRVSALRELTFQ